MYLGLRWIELHETGMLVGRNPSSTRQAHVKSPDSTFQGSGYQGVLMSDC